ncbi:hypothetical protein Tco_0742829, partial [Tanacetum coccineum]
MSKLLEDVWNISEELSEYINCPSWNRLLFYDNDDDEYTIIYSKPKAITPDLPIEEPDNSLSMGDEHLDTIPSVENLVPIPRTDEPKRKPKSKQNQARNGKDKVKGKQTCSLNHALLLSLLLGTDISQKDEKPSKKRQIRTRDGKVCEDEAQSKSSQLREEKEKKNIT